MNIWTARPHRLLPHCIDAMGALAAQGERSMFLVPSQYTLQAEIEIMTRLKLEGTFLIDVLSPGRLQSRIFERAGAPRSVMLDERGKLMVVSQIIEEQKNELLIYGMAARSGTKGFAQKLSSLIADLKRSGTTPDELLEKAEAMDERDTAKRKLIDAARLYAAYASRMEGKLADAEDRSAAAMEKLARSGVVREQHVFVYGFDMITPTFAAELLSIAAEAKSLTLAIETDANAAPDGRLFAPVNASLDRLRALARERGIELHTTRIEGPLTSPEDIRFLEENLFAIGRRPYAAPPEHIALTAYSGMRAEAHGVAAKIRRALFEGADSTDIAVVYPKGSGYGAVLADIFPLYDLPIYLAEKRSAAAHPLSRCLLSALAVVSDGWRTGDVLEYVRSGFSGLTEEAADALCAYAAGTDLRESSWKKPFVYIKNQETALLETVEAARAQAVEPLLALEKALRTAEDAEGSILAVVDFLERIDAFDTLGDMRLTLIEEGLNPEAEDCAQVWNQLMETLDQLHMLLGTTAAPAKLARELLQSGLSALELSALPPADGAIICGEIGNLRTAQVGTLFAMGMNDAQSAGENGLLTAVERESAARATGAYLGMSTAESAALGMLDQLKMLGGAGERLEISLALADDTGRALREGATIQALRRCFPELKMTGGTEAEEQEGRLVSARAALEPLSIHLSDAAEGSAELGKGYAAVYRALSEDEGQREKLLEITKSLSSAPHPRLNERLARQLYGRPVMSVSRLETFAACPYRYFVRYGLAPREEIKPGVDRGEVGTMYHEAAEAFTREIMKQPDFPNIPPEACDRIMEEAMRPLAERFAKSPLGESRRGAAYLRRISKTASRMGRNIVSQYAGSEFRPLGMELTFGQNGVAPIMLRLADGTTVYLQGRIDRIDVLDQESRAIRVVDYKSGTHGFDPTRVYWGLQLQLLIYLAAALMEYPGTEAAGFFYCSIADPMIQTESRIQEEVERQIAKKLALAGISLSDVAILRAQDVFHQAMVTKDNQPSGRYAASMTDREGMRGMTEFAKARAAEIAQSAYQGEIADAPAELAGWNACKSCGYAAVCGFDPTIRKRHKLKKKKIEDLHL